MYNKINFSFITKYRPNKLQYSLVFHFLGASQKFKEKERVYISKI